MRKPLDSAIFLAIVTAVLYSWSTARYHGFLSTIGLDADMMERSFHQVVYSGLVVSFDKILILLLILTLALFLWSRAIVPSYVDYVRKSIKNKRNIIKIKNRIIGKRKAPSFEISAIKKSNTVAIYCLIGFLFVFSLIYFENKGQAFAKNAIEAHFNGETSEKNKIKVMISNSEKALSFLACGANNCAGIEDKTNKIIYYPQSSGFVFEYKKKNVTK